jgi:Protein of unknown function (DUF1553)/Protein of unknown function (DUF1549)/Bacterial Ig-like domain (group 2)
MPSRTFPRPLSAVWGIALAAAASLLVVSRVSAAPEGPQGDSGSGPRFSRHIVPLFSRLGCNAGLCHGAVKGQNGFRLSLFGVDPEQDRQTLIAEYGGRRLNLFRPDDSLLLLKATGRVPHQGGKRTAVGSREYELLRTWIARGAPLDRLEESRVTRLRVSPERQTVRPGERSSLQVEAAFADGSRENVTSLCTFAALDTEVASVDGSGQVTAVGTGDTALVVRYGAEPVVAHIVVPRAGKTPFPDVKPNNFIDEQILAKLRRLNVPPSGLCDDATFLRRACLDVTGALPEPDEVRTFLADRSPNKREKKIDELLLRPGHAALWATWFCDLLKVSGFNGNYAFVEAAEDRRFYEWMRARLLENLPYDQLAERILTATSREGRPQQEWFAEVMALAEENARRSPDLKVYARRKTLDLYWQREGATGVKGTLQVAHAFLGLRLECAQCHRHPHDVWKQDDLLSFANFFMRVQGARYPDSKRLPPKIAEQFKKAPAESKKLNADAKKLLDQIKKKKLSGDEAEKLRSEALALQMKARATADGPRRFGTEVHHMTDRTSYASVSSPLGNQRSETFRLLGDAKPVKVAKETDPRPLVAAWLRRPDNPFFARAIVNRVWAHYLGRGLVDPPDHLSPLNPPSHPELLDELAKQFIAQRYDLRWLHRTILGSRTYQQGCRPTPANRADRRNYAYFYLRRLPAEVLVDAVNHATGGHETYPEKLYLPEGARAIEVAGVTRAENETASLAFAFQIFGRPLRNAQVQCDCDRDGGNTIVQALYLANHPRVREKIAAPEGRVAQILKGTAGDSRRVEELFLWAVSRPPTGEELQTCLKYLKDSPSAQKGLEDILWGLLNTREFILNH